MNWINDETQRQRLLELVDPTIRKEAHWHASRQRVWTYEEDIIKDIQLRLIEKVVKQASEPVDDDLQPLDQLTLGEAKDLLIAGGVLRRWTKNRARQYRYRQAPQRELLENVDQPIMPEYKTIRILDLKRGIRNLVDRSALTKGEAEVAEAVLIRAVSDDEPKKPLSARERKAWSRARAKIAKLTKSGVLSCLLLLLAALTHFPLVRHTMATLYQPDQTFTAGHQPTIIAGHQQPRTFADHQPRTIAGHQKDRQQAVTGDHQLTIVAGHQQPRTFADHQPRIIAGHQRDRQQAVTGDHQLTIVAGHQQPRTFAGHQPRIIAGHQRDRRQDLTEVA